MACLNPNCRSNQHTGVCRANQYVQDQNPVAPAVLVPAQANVQPWQDEAARMRGQLAADRNTPNMQAMSAHFERARQIAALQQQQIASLQQSLYEEQRKRRQAESVLGVMQNAPAPAQQACPACPPPPPPCPACASPNCPTCPTCGSEQQPMPVMGNPSVVGNYIGQQVGPDFTQAQPPPPSTQSDFTGQGNQTFQNPIDPNDPSRIFDQTPIFGQDQSGQSSPIDLSPVDQGGQAVMSDQTPPDQGMVSNVLLAQQPEPAYAIANPGMLAGTARPVAAAPDSSFAVAPAMLAQAAQQTAQPVLTAAPIVPVLRVNQAQLMAAAAQQGPTTSSIQGICKNCKSRVTVGCGGASTHIGGYNCGSCGYAHVGAPRYIPSNKVKDSRVIRVMRQYQQGLLSYAQAKARLINKLNLSAADATFVLSH